MTWVKLIFRIGEADRDLHVAEFTLHATDKTLGDVRFRHDYLSTSSGGSG